MGQVTIYVDDELEVRLKKEAKSAGVSVSKWVTELIQQRTANQWPHSVKELSGAWQDFPNIEELRKTDTSDIEREPF